MFGKNKYRYIDMFLLFVKLVPGMTTVYVIHNLIQFIIPTLKIIATAYFIDTAVAIANANGADMHRIIIPIIILVSFSLFDYVISLVMSILTCRTNNKILLSVEPNIIERMSKIKYKYYENRANVDVLFRAANNFTANISNFFFQVFSFLTSVFGIVGFLIVLGIQLWWASLIMIVLCIPIYIIGYKSGIKKYETDKNLTKLDRKVGYIGGILTSRDTVDERYIFGYVDKLSDDFRKNYEYSRIERKKVERKRHISMKSTSCIVAVAAVIIIGVLISPTINGSISIGMFTSLAGTIFMLGSTLSTGISGHILDFKHKFEYLKDLNIFLSYEVCEGLTDPPAEVSSRLETIEFQNVSFQYPGTGIYILKNISFTLNTGKHYAFVGANGAGKTTITKLLTGLYDEYEGNILINGRNLREYTPSEIMAFSAVVYQDFARYPVDFYDNIALGDVLHMDNTAKIDESVFILGLKDVIAKLHDGYKTPLTKVDENGVDLSGGEWQRVALARLNINTAPLKILDEPTAALDPVAESHIYEQFGEIINRNHSSDNITVFISHRLGSIKLADEILVVADGHIVEQGTFDDLMDKGGVFAEMYETQAKWYRET